MFIDELRLTKAPTSNNRLVSYQFQLFLDYCKENKYKDTSKKYFVAQLAKRGFTTKKLGKQNKTYLVGETDEEFIEVLNESDEELDHLQ